MRLEEALFRYLSANAGVIALLGSGAACALYEQEAPDGSQVPYAVYNNDSNEDRESFGRAASAAKAHVVLSCYAATPQAAEAIAQSIHDALLNPAGDRVSFTGAMGGYTYINQSNGEPVLSDGINVLAILFDGRSSDVELDYYSTSRMYLETVDVSIIYTI